MAGFRLKALRPGLLPLADQLGQSTPRMVMGVYRHRYPDSTRGVAGVADSLLG